MKNMIVFRVDSSIKMGSGHVMRCLTLANELRSQDTDLVFICRNLPGNMCEFIRQNGYKVCSLPFSENDVVNSADEKTIWSGTDWQTDASQTIEILKKLNAFNTVEWLITDHYGFDKQWETLTRPYVKNIMVIDDLADREHDCDVLLDQNYYKNAEARYKNLVPKHCRQFIGPQFILLRNEFSVERERLRRRDGTVKRMLIFFGGGDPTNETAKALRSVKMLAKICLNIDVVVGHSYPFFEDLKLICSSMSNIVLHRQVNNMAHLMAAADLAIGAGGTANWERCYLGLPSIILITADNQREVTKAVASYGAALNLGWHADVSPEYLYENISGLLNNANILRNISERALNLMGVRSAKQPNWRELLMRYPYDLE